METAIGLVQELELQKSSRLESLAHATFELITISHSLSRPVPVLYQALLDSLPTEALTSPSSLLTHFTSLGLVPPLSLHRDCVRGLEAARQQIKAEYEQLLADVDAVVIEIRTVWDQMQVPHNERRDLPRDIQCLAEYRALVAALHKRWREKMEAEVNEMYARLRVLWLQCHVPESEQHAYDHDDDQDASWFYTPHTLAAMSADVARLTARYQRFRDIYALMDSRAALIARMVAFEKTASDPARLFRPSFQLMEEDRFRRSAYPTLLKTEQEIRDAVARVQSSDNGEKDVVVENVQVLWNGESVLETLKRECEARFVNAAVFVLDGTTQSKNAAGKQHAAAGGAKTTGAVIAPAAGPSDPSVNGRPSASPMHRRPAAATSANTPGRTTHSAKYRTLTPPSASQRKSPNSKPPALTSSPPTNLKMSNSSLPTTTSTGNTASASTANIPTASGLRRASSRSTKNQTSRSPGK
ncbi:hypothetical protein DFJ77DRAFT_66603 [Powellomyces hirtus]|nr:hypothetical protein DFJ77DRAFT_66603 [Powellomyces hirtus]